MAVVATLTPLLPSNQLSNDLSFSAAHITGPIPSEIGRLSKLTSAVRFYSNSLTYSIPSELGQLSVPMKLFCHAHEHTGLNLYNSPCTYSHFQQLADTLQLNENSLSGYRRCTRRPYNFCMKYKFLISLGNDLLKFTLRVNTARSILRIIQNFFVSSDH